MDGKQQELPVELTVQNIGGIDQAQAAFEPGMTVLAGRNATNRTSLLQAIMAVLGSDDVSLKADTDEGYVELTLDGETHSRTLERRDGTVHLHGNPYLDDSTLTDLFAFLLEPNEARRAVVTDANLRDIIMQPVDTDEIRAEIDRLLEERQRISQELEELDDLKRRLPALEEQRTELQTEIDEKRAELQDVEEDIEASNADVEEGHEEQEVVEEKLEVLREKRSELDDVRYELETEQESLESLRTEKREVEREYEELPASDDRLEDVEARIDQLRTRRQDIESELNEVQSVIQFNQERLADGTGSFSEVFDDEEEPLTDELLPEETVTCWTCGTEVNTDQIEATIERLQESSQELVGQINDMDDELADLTERRRDLEESRQKRKQLERRQEELETELEETEARIETLSERRDDLHEEIDAIESEVESLESDGYEEILSLHREANQLEYELGRLETDLERVEENIASIEEHLDEEADLKARREDISEQLEELRTRIKRTEQQAIEKFNKHMDTVLEKLRYENLERIWLERKETEQREGRRKVITSEFDLHIVRQTDGGATYEDTVDNLSESEREVTGLIFALSGYLAHQVYDTVPFMLLDSVEAIDSERIATLAEYVEDYCDYLVIALLPEDAAAIDVEHQRITEI